MRAFHFILSLFLLITSPITAQNTINVKGQVVNSAFVFQKKLRVQINQRLLSTDDSGFFQVSLPKTNTHFKIDIPEDGFIVLYPVAGFVPIPTALNDIPVIVVGKPNELTAFKDYELLLKKYSAGNDVQKRAMKDTMELWRVRLLTLGITAAKLAKAEKSVQDKNNYLMDLTTHVLAFQQRVIEVKSNFTWLAPKALEDGAALDALLRSVNDYNKCYNRFDSLQLFDEGAQRQHELDAHLRSLLNSYADFITLRVHASGVYPTQETVLQIRQYYSGKKKTKEQRRSLEEQVKKQSVSMERFLKELEGKTKEIILALVGADR